MFNFKCATTQPTIPNINGWFQEKGIRERIKKGNMWFMRGAEGLIPSEIDERKVDKGL